MLTKNATVTIAHSQTKDLKAVCSRADVLIAAIGNRNSLIMSMLKMVQ